ncbi:pentatricopeptide repeat-containing protein At2g21090 isoform X2 [Diospyros lotus]|uniref:pentatricopeptide repeat-containing protein At2g21090 isoform X2 n=1 Tax=Diospyros lotus TaxID=55363 RepID=UPI002258625B|nr:pentatricopeptide repeat-containing protein At2g21090 isoform X2 [Diospyros lotus]
MPSLSSTGIVRALRRTKPNSKLEASCIVRPILDLCSQGRLTQAVGSLDLLVRKGLRLNTATLAFLLQQCANSKSLKEGKWVHLHLKLTGLKKPNSFLSNHLINMYCKCGNHVEARKVFDKMAARNLYSWNNMLSGYTKLGMIKPAKRIFDTMPEKDVVSWNTMIIAYAKNGYCNDALRFYRDMRRLSIGFNEFSFAGALTVCVKLKEMGLTSQVHCQVFVTGFLSNVVLSSTLIDAYAKCSQICSARRLFDEMTVRDVLAWTTLVSGYARWGDMQSARKLFDAMPEKNPVSWTALIAGYARNNMEDMALKLFTEMMLLQIRPDQFTFSSCLCACATMASLKHGKQIHTYLIRMGLKPNTIVVSSLIDMYSKCGSLGVSRLVFDIMGNKQDYVLWNTMLSALAHHGCGEEAAKMYDDMVRSGVKPDRITLVVMLNACSHSGLVQEGLRYFQSMTCEHGIVPDQEHYACLIDLLGRAGCFDQMMKQLQEMHCEPDGLIWNAVLGVCRIHGNLELGGQAAEKLIELEPQTSAAYIFLSSVYATLGRWESVEKVRQLMNERGVKKERAISWVEVEGVQIPSQYEK